MKSNKGFIELRSIQDYWDKLLFDYSELKEKNENVYVAFNFFVTAYHLLDWVFEGKYSDERTQLNNKPIVKICNHISNGIKHFETDSHRHNSVKEIEKERYVKKGYVQDGYFESPIIIYLDENLKSEFGDSIEISELADKVMDFWKFELKTRNLVQ